MPNEPTPPSDGVNPTPPKTQREAYDEGYAAGFEGRQIDPWPAGQGAVTIQTKAGVVDGKWDRDNALLWRTTYEFEVLDTAPES
jgi:hypothetical protein